MFGGYPAKKAHVSPLPKFFGRSEGETENVLQEEHSLYSGEATAPSETPFPRRILDVPLYRRIVDLREDAIELSVATLTTEGNAVAFPGVKVEDLRRHGVVAGQIERRPDSDRAVVVGFHSHVDIEAFDLNLSFQ